MRRESGVGLELAGDFLGWLVASTAIFGIGLLFGASGPGLVMASLALGMMFKHIRFRKRRSSGA